MKDFNLKKYLAEGRLLKENKTVTADMWAIMSDDQKMDALLTVFKDFKFTPLGEGIKKVYDNFSKRHNR